MKIALVRLQLLRSHILNYESVVHSVGDYDVAVAIVVSGCQQGADICEDCMVEIYAGWDSIASDRDVAEIRVEYERITGRCGRGNRRAAAGSRIGGSLGGQARGRGVADWHTNHPIAIQVLVETGLQRLQL